MFTPVTLPGRCYGVHSMESGRLDEVNRLNLVLSGLDSRNFDCDYIRNLADQVECGIPQEREKLIEVIHYCAEYLGDENIGTFEELEAIYKYAAAISGSLETDEVVMSGSDWAKVWHFAQLFDRDFWSNNSPSDSETKTNPMDS